MKKFVLLLWRLLRANQSITAHLPTVVYLFRARPGIPLLLSTYKRVRSAARLPRDPLRGETAPPIELLIVAAPKDFQTLEASILAAIRMSTNPIERITVVVPEAASSHPVLANLAAITSAPLSVLAEEEVIDVKIRNQLKLKFNDRYGWVLQQLLTTSLVSASNSCGVLAIDSDTLLTAPRTLLSSSGRQILTPTFELHQPYYDFLVELGMTLRTPIRSFVPHSMLMQPIYMNEALSAAGCDSSSELAMKVVKFSDGRLGSSVCVEFELYAQYMYHSRPENVTLAEWANFDLYGTRPATEIANLTNLTKFIGHYSRWGSVSIHSYNR